MQVREQNESGAEVAVFALKRLLHFHHHLGAVPHIGGACNQFRSRCCVFRIRKSAAEARTLLDQYLVTFLDKANDSCRCNGYAILVILDFLGYSDDHSTHLLSLWMSLM
ncbi:hypothetical protein D3C81_316890 [compost metagenome]